MMELVVAMAIIALIAAVAIPNMLRARVNANESMAVTSMRTLIQSLENFRSAQAPMTYPGAGVVSVGVPATGLADLAIVTPSYLDPVLASGSKGGYSFTYTPGTARTVTLNGVTYNVYETYTLTAVPLVSGLNGIRGFYGDQTGVIRGNATGAAGPGDFPVE